MTRQWEGWLWKCFCKTAAGRPLSASDYKFIFCKGTFWHNVHGKDIKSNLSANESRKWMWRRERQHILLKYVDTPLRSQRVPLPDTKGWNVLISADSIYAEKTSSISLRVSKTPVLLTPAEVWLRGLCEAMAGEPGPGPRACRPPSPQHRLLPQSSWWLRKLNSLFSTTELNKTLWQEEPLCPEIACRVRGQHHPHCSPKRVENVTRQQGVGSFCLQTD